MPTFAGDVEVTVTPDTSDFRRRLETGAIPAATRAAERIGQRMGEVIARRIAEGIREGLSGLKTGAAGTAAGTQFGRAFARSANTEIKTAIKDVSVKVDADTAKARAEIKTLGEITRRSLAESISAGMARGAAGGSREIPRSAPRAGAEYGGRFGASLKARLEEAFADLPDVEIDADSSRADIAIREIRGQLEALRDKKVGVDITATDALRRVAEIRAQLERLEAESPDVQVRVDAASASARLAAFDAEVRRVDGRTATVDVDVDTSAARSQLSMMDGAAGGSIGRIGALVTAAAAVGPALVPIGAVGVGALGALGVAAIGAASGVGVLLLALRPVVEAVQAVTKAEAGSAVAASSARAGQSALASSMRAVEDAGRAVSRAVQDAKDREVAAARAIENAQRSLTDATEQSARDRIDALRDIERAERDLADAERDVLDAEQALADARREAAEDMEDLNSRIVRGDLERREAALRLAEARDRLAEVEADPQATELERERARLAVEQALQGLRDQEAELGRLVEARDEATAAGVDGSDRVRDAQDRLTDAQRRAGDAEQAVADAAEDAGRRREESRRRIEDAERRLAEAQADAARSQRDSAQAIEDAQRGVERAQDAVREASQRAGSAGSAAMGGVADAMAKLTTAGRSFVTFITTELMPAFSGLSKTAQDGFLPGVERGLRSLLPLMPTVTKLVDSVSKAMGGLAESAGKALTGPFWSQFFEFLAETAGPALTVFGRTLGNLITGFAALFQAFAPIGVAVGDVFLGLSRSFAEWAQNLPKSEGFQKLLGYVADTGPLVLQTIGSLGSAVVNLIRAMAPAGPVVLGIVNAVAQFIASIPPGVIAGIVVGVLAAAAAFSVLNGVMALVAMNPVTLVIGAVVAVIAALVAGLVIAYRESEAFRRLVDTSWRAIRDAVSEAWTQRIGPAFNEMRSALRDDLKPAVEDFVRAIGPLVSALNSGLGPAISQAFGGAIRIAEGVIGGIAGALRVVVGILTLDWREAWSGAGTVVDSAVLAIAGTIDRTTAPLTGFFAAIRSGSTGAARDLDGTSGAVSGFTESVVNAQGSVRDLVAAQNDLAEASREVSSETLSARDAENAYWAAIDTATESVRANGATLDVHTEKGRANRQSLDDIADAANKYTQKLADNGASHDVLRQKQELARKKLIDVATQMGMTRDQAVRYTDKVLAIPKEAKTEVKTPGADESRRAIDGVKRSTDEAAASSRTAGDTFVEMWKRIKNAAKVPVRFVIEKVVNEGIIGTWKRVAGWFGVNTDRLKPVPLPEGFATGGYISGPGTGVSDSVLARLSNGEYVMRAAVVKRLGVDYFNRLNAIDRKGDFRGDPGAGIQKYATGGVVDSVQATKAWLPSVDPLPYVWGAVGPRAFDCSGLTGEVYNRLTGRPSYRRAFTTASDFASIGFAPGRGLYTIGVNPGKHMAGNLAGLPFEAASTATGIFVGRGAQDVNAFSRNYYLTKFGGSKKGDPGGIDMFNPIGSVIDMFKGALKPLDGITGNPFGRLVAAMPHALVDAAKDWMRDKLPGFAAGGLVKYDQGGYLPPGVTTVLNATGSPEPVLTPRQWDSMQGGQRPINVNITNPVPETASESTSRIMRRLVTVGAGG